MQQARCSKIQMHAPDGTGRILSEMTRLPSLPIVGVLPNFGPTGPPPDDSHLAINIAARDLERFAEKVVSGVVFTERGMFIDERFTLESYVLSDEDAENGLGPFGSLIGVLERGPGFVVRRAVSDDARSGVYAIEIWGQLKLYATVLPASLDGPPGRSALQNVTR